MWNWPAARIALPYLTAMTMFVCHNIHLSCGLCSSVPQDLENGLTMYMCKTDLLCTLGGVFNVPLTHSALSIP